MERVKPGSVFMSEPSGQKVYTILWIGDEGVSFLQEHGGIHFWKAHDGIVFGVPDWRLLSVWTDNLTLL